MLVVPEEMAPLTTCIANIVANIVPTPERRCTRAAVGADHRTDSRLRLLLFHSSDGGHDCGGTVAWYCRYVFNTNRYEKRRRKQLPLFGIGEDVLSGSATVLSFALPSASASSSGLISTVRALRVLLNVGHPEQAVAPPVPSQRPSPGHVPPCIAAARRVRGLRGIGVPGFDAAICEPSVVAARVFGKAGEAVRLTVMRFEGRGTRRDLR
jgi:hypothetical protein